MEKPMLFSGPMVRALLDGSKTQTRRIIKPQIPEKFLDIEPIKPDSSVWRISGDAPTNYDGEVQMNDWSFEIKCPHPVGSRIWGKETWQYDRTTVDKSRRAMYRATCGHSWERFGKWKPSIHMPRWASRITLEVEALRVERLQDISDEDAKAEGCELVETVRGLKTWAASYRAVFQSLWAGINGPGSWELNPWVWAYTIERIKQ